MSVHAEICIVGGGPAGATLAARLAQLGHDVVIVEQHRFPRPHVGESFSPGAWPILDQLGVGDRVRDGGFTSTATARVRWRDDREELVGVPGGLTVDRGRFDAILLEHARACGARVLAPARARAPARAGDSWTLVLGDSVLRAGFLADATGRRRLLRGPCAATAPRTLALHAVWHDGGATGDAQTRVEALPEGWLWGARLPDGAFRAMAFVDPQTLRAEGRDSGRLYRRLLAGSRIFADLPRSAAMAQRVQVCAATTYAATTPIDGASVKLGEAAFAIDPLSSSGVQTAIQTGLCAAAAVHTILTPAGDGEAAIAYYRAHQCHAVQRHATTAAGLYAEHRPHAHEAFWRSRSAAVRPPARTATTLMTRPATAPALADLLAARVRLPAGAALRDTPCVVGDRIERRRALTHPVLDRPVAFLGGDELAPLLDELPAAPSLADAIERWRRALPVGRADAIARWLHARGLLVSKLG